MHSDQGQLLLSPSDLTGFLDCEHLTQLDAAVAARRLAKPELEDPELDIVRRRGAEHEDDILQAYRATGCDLVEISRPTPAADAYRSAQEETRAAMRAAADVIYQAVLFDGRWVGYADFLEKVQLPSSLGQHSYEVVDTKLARRAKTAALVQTTLYSILLQPLQGISPRHMHLVLGDGQRHSFRVADYSSYVQLARTRLEQAVSNQPSTYPEPVAHCDICRWRNECLDRWIADDHLTLVAGMRRDQANRLRGQGIRTLAQLAESPPDLEVPRMGIDPTRRLQLQARLQADGRTSDKLLYELLPPVDPGPALADLPEPVDGDLYFDLEGDPYVDGGLEYLFGLTEITSNGTQHHVKWAHSRNDEKLAFEAVVDQMISSLNARPSIHVYHYGSYEATALKRLMGLHATRESEVDRLLRGGVLVDLYQIVRKALRTSQSSYSLKAIEAFYMADREGKLRDAGSSIVAYERWLERRDDTLLSDIELYNKEDCESTLHLREWLDSLRPEFETKFGLSLSRPGVQEGRPDAQQEERENETARLSDALTGPVPRLASERTADQRARWLLGQALWFHRREQKSEWWSYFQWLDMTDQELLDDPDALSGLSYLGEVRQLKQSVVHAYGYPQQEHKILPGSRPLDPRTQRPVGVVDDVDLVEGRIFLRRAVDSQVPHPTNLIPGHPPNDMPLRMAIRRVAEWVLTNSMNADGPYRAVRDLLLRNPRLPSISAMSANEAGVAMAVQLDGTCLGIQGPPGSGKTSVGAEMVLALIEQHKTVGLTALSHKVISHFLEAVIDESRRRGMNPRLLQKAEPEDFCGLSEVKRCNANADVIEALRGGAADIVAGTAWLFADPAIDGLLDTLFVDEAGQVPLANVVAVAGAARNMVLLGDPNQLAQPIHGVHPDGAAVSSLEHLLGDDATMPAGRGLFLDRSWRMQPSVCSFVSDMAYEGRLGPAPGCELQSVGGQAGIVFLPVEHSGNRTSSIEEATAVAELVKSLIGQEWIDRQGRRAEVDLSDVLIVAPYNSQVGLLGKTIYGARVGTVDKFQGQQAAVAIYSMATSSPDEVPHGVDFLYSVNRLNVAVSRAQALAYVICSPKLLLLRPRSPEQMRLANALCTLWSIGAST